MLSALSAAYGAAVHSFALHDKSNGCDDRRVEGFCQAKREIACSWKWMPHLKKYIIIKDLCRFPIEINRTICYPLHKILFRIRRDMTRAWGAKIEEGTINSWGFTCYKVNKLGPLAGTLMAIDPDAPKLARCITLGGDSYLIRYNSHLPLVVYVPEDVEVRYRIWTAGGGQR
jgi:Ecotin